VDYWWPPAGIAETMAASRSSIIDRRTDHGTRAPSSLP
jgi:hypothetical protein